MNVNTPTRRGINDVKVDFSETSHGMNNIRIEWMDAVNERQHFHFYGFAAEQLNNDIRAVTVMGEEYRKIFLVGLIRGFCLERRAH